MNGGAVSGAREAILSAVRNAIAGGAAPEPVGRTYRRNGVRSRPERIALFCERVGEYRATVRRVAPSQLRETLDELRHLVNCVRCALDDGCEVEFLQRAEP